MSEPKKYVDVRGAAQIFPLSPATWAKLRCRGGGPPFIHAGGKVLYPLPDLLAWIDSHPLQRSTSDDPNGSHRRPRAGRPRRAVDAA